MDQTKQNSDILRRQMIVEAERWMFAPSAWECALVDEIRQLPIYTVPRLPKAEALPLGMRPKNCHLNAVRFARQDPDHKTYAVAGWFRQGNLYFLHSVILRDGMLQCVTPMPRIPGDSIDFAPDPAIEWRAIDGKATAWRNGRAVGIGVRVSPAETLALFGPVLARLRAGMDPDQAIQKTRG